MKLADAPNVYGYTIFCDDIRFEVGGKLTYVGAYQGEMVVQGQFPIVLPKIAMHFFYFQRRPDVVPPTKIIIVTPGSTEENPTFTIGLSEPEALNAMANAEAQAQQRGTEALYMTLGGPATLTNFPIKEPGHISIRAVRGDEFIRLGRLRVSQDPKFASAQQEAPAQVD